MTAHSFAAHVALLDEVLARRQPIVERIEHRLLNVKGKGVPRPRDRPLVETALAACVFEGLPRDVSALGGALADARRADGFEPLFRHSAAHQLDAAHLVIRACEHWERERWPGANARLVFADRVYTAFVLRQLEDLSLRIWDAGEDDAPAALNAIQRLLDALNRPPASAVLVRDARWLLQTAQGPLTKALEPYFALADRIDASFPGASGLEIHKAGARLAGGHLRSQLRYRSAEMRRDADDPLVLATTRNSNSMDVGLLVRELVTLLRAYEHACAGGVRESRRELADVIVQGCSADPELLVTRLDLLEPATMIEELFVQRHADGHLMYSARGERHLATLAAYGTLINTLAAPLTEDARHCDPAARAYSPFALTYGFCADLVSNMAADALHGDSATNASLEAMFESHDTVPARVERWPGCEHSIAWGSRVFTRTMNALQARSAADGRPNASGVRDARLFVVTRGTSVGDLPPGSLPKPIVSAQEHLVTSDVQGALASGATAFPKNQIVSDRSEGRFLGSAEVGGTWFGVSKVALTVCTGQGQDALLTDVPPEVCQVTQMTCRHVAVFPPKEGAQG